MFYIDVWNMLGRLDDYKKIIMTDLRRIYFMSARFAGSLYFTVKLMNINMNEYWA